jgi:hypothetical protein
MSNTMANTLKTPAKSQTQKIKSEKQIARMTKKSQIEYALTMLSKGILLF